MKEYCVDLEIAKELKINGFPQNTCYFFADFGGGYSFGNGFATTTNKVYSPTTDEILKELPSNFIYDNNHYWLTIIKDNENNYQAYYEKTLEDGFKSKMLFRIIDKKLSNCLSLTWLYLKKEGYIK